VREAQHRAQLASQGRGGTGAAPGSATLGEQLVAMVRGELYCSLAYNVRARLLWGQSCLKEK